MASAGSQSRVPEKPSHFQHSGSRRPATSHRGNHGHGDANDWTMRFQFQAGAGQEAAMATALRCVRTNERAAAAQHNNADRIRTYKRPTFLSFAIRIVSDAGRVSVSPHSPCRRKSYRARTASSALTSASAWNGRTTQRSSRPPLWPTAAALGRPAAAALD